MSTETKYIWQGSHLHHTPDGVCHYKVTINGTDYEVERPVLMVMEKLQKEAQYYKDAKYIVENLRKDIENHDDAMRRLEKKEREEEE